MSELPNPNDPPMDAALASLEPGFLVGQGRFTLVRLIGRGGMGVVWLARDESLREDVALKFLPPEIRFDAVGLDDLRRETARARKLTHPNIIRIHDLCRDDREAFISMEYIDGANLSDLRLLQPERVFTWEFLEPFVKQLCDALDYAHGEKVIHRDLKPANLMLDARGRLKLSDFGIAAQASDSVHRISMIRHGQSGTVTYMSPQQMDGKLPQATDDIYALGATLYELLTSRPPFSSGDIAYQVRNILPQPLDERLAELGIENEVPPPVAALIMACLGKSPEQRPASARAVAEWIGLQPATTPASFPAVSPEKPATSADQIAECSRPTETVRAEELKPAVPLREKARTILPPRPESEFVTKTEETAPALAAPPPRPAATNSARAPLIIATLVFVILAMMGAGAFVWWKTSRARSGETTLASAPAPNAANATPTVITPVQVSPPPAAEGESVALFNGRDLTGWDGDLAVWSVVDGTIRGRLRKATDAAKPSALFWRGGALENFELSFSFRLLQAGNSGVYYHAAELPNFNVGGYQFEIMRGGLGHLYDTGQDRDRRDLQRRNSDRFQSDEWHTARITVTGRRIKHAIDDIVLFDFEDTAPSAPLSGVLALEATGGPTTVDFKDIRLKRLKRSEASAAVVGSWKTLFNGTSLDAWRGWKGASWIVAWSIMEQELHSLPGGTINLATREQYGDFELELEWKIAPGANSGVLYRALPSGAEPWQTAPEYQIVDDARHPDGRKSVTATGSIYGVVPPEHKTLRPAGEFNATRIIVRGSQTEHWLNGVKLLEADLASPEVQRAAFKKFNKAAWGEPRHGYIVLQNIGSEASFRNIRVRRLDER